MVGKWNFLFGMANSQGPGYLIRGYMISICSESFSGPTFQSLACPPVAAPKGWIYPSGQRPQGADVNKRRLLSVNSTRTMGGWLLVNSLHRVLPKHCNSWFFPVSLWMLWAWLFVSQWRTKSHIMLCYKFVVNKDRVSLAPVRHCCRW